MCLCVRVCAYVRACVWVCVCVCVSAWLDGSHGDLSVDLTLCVPVSVTYRLFGDLSVCVSICIAGWQSWRPVCGFDAVCVCQRDV